MQHSAPPCAIGRAVTAAQRAISREMSQHAPCGLLPSNRRNDYPGGDSGPVKGAPFGASLRDGASATLEYARHGRSIGGESPLEEEVVLTPSRRQLRRCEAGWEGSPRRIPAPRNTNRV
jgi:hypothetical protein